MHNARVIRRADDMPLYGLIMRVAKGKYQVTIKAKASKRVVDIDIILLPSRPAVKALYARFYPTMTWGEPKYPKPKLKLPKRVKRTKAKRRTIPAKKPRKPRVRKEKRNEPRREVNPS